MKNEHEAIRGSPWHEGRIVGPTKMPRDEGAAGAGYFRTLATPGSVAPDLTPSPWSFSPGLPQSCDVESAILLDDAFCLQLRNEDKTAGTLRCAVTGPGILAGETDAAAHPSLFSPTHEAEERDGAWVVEAPGHAAVLVVDLGETGLRFGLAWGKGDVPTLASAARAVLGIDLRARFPEDDAASAEAVPSIAAMAEPSRLASVLVRHGATILTAVLALIAVVTVASVAMAPGSGERNRSELSSLADRLVTEGRYDEARGIYEDMGSVMERGKLALSMGRLSFRQGDYEDAAKHYLTASEEGAYPEAALLNHALSLYRQGRVEEAIIVYEKCIDTFGEEYTNLAQRAAAAIEVLNEAEKTLPPKNVGH